MTTDPIIPLQPKPIPAAPKYDPCRLFKRGDKVRLVTFNGRTPYDLVNEDEYKPDETIFSVMNDECICGLVDLYENSPEDGFQIHHSNLELVTPVEELEPYYVKENASVYEVFNRNENNSSVAIFFKSQYTKGKAKERAEAERDRLNEEWKNKTTN